MEACASEALSVDGAVRVWEGRSVPSEVSLTLCQSSSESVVRLRLDRRPEDDERGMTDVLDDPDEGMRMSS